MKSGVFNIEMGLLRSWGGAELGLNWCVAHVARGPLRELIILPGAAPLTTYSVRPLLLTTEE